MLSSNLKIENLIEIWKEAVETQMHFNDLLIKMRTTVISIILAVFGGSAIALRDMNWYADIFGQQVRLSALIIALGLIFLFVQFLVDSLYYFKLLLGSVEYTRCFGKKYNIPELSGLTESIIKSVSSKSAYLILILYYAIPFLLGILTILVIQNLYQLPYK